MFDDYNSTDYSLLYFFGEVKAMMINKFAGVVAVLVSLIVLPLTGKAQDFKPYMGIGAGVFAIQMKINDPLAGFAEQRNPTAGAFIKAGVDIGKYFGGELRFGLTGNPSTDWGPGLPVGDGFVTLVPSTVSTKITNFFSYFGKLQYPFDESFKVYALLGGTTANFSSTLSIVGLNLP
ncbi:MAG: outer membrane beta-barrel protein, partial [Mariprofundaceae bacterium]|nr:outer membrane beta-barrel protein [Mariprofundaceae bacterium]